MHPRKPAECLAYMGNDDSYEARCTDQLKEGCQTFSSRELKRGTKKQHTGWNQHCNGFGKCRVHTFVLISTLAAQVTFSVTAASFAAHCLAAFPEDERHDEERRNRIRPREVPDRVDPDSQQGNQCKVGAHLRFRCIGSKRRAFSHGGQLPFLAGIRNATVWSGLNDSVGRTGDHPGSDVLRYAVPLRKSRRLSACPQWTRKKEGTHSLPLPVYRAPGGLQQDPGVP